jgi:adenylate cyclase
MDRMLAELLRRRVPQMLGIYLAGGWGLLEFTDWAAGRFQPVRDPTPAVLGLLLVGLPIFMVVAWRLGGREEEQDEGSVPADPRTVAVLPFDVLGGDPDTRYLGLGLADQILNGLSRVKDLRVAARTSSFAYRDAGLDVRELGRRLGVRAVLEGSVQKAGERLRVTAQLVEVEGGYHLWSRRWDGTMEDVFRIQDEVAEGVARALDAILREGEEASLRSRPTGDVQAYEAYLRGRAYLVDGRRKTLGWAREMFRRALEIDPDFALAHTGLAEATAVLGMYYPAVARTELDSAAGSAERALALAPELPEGWAALGAVRFLQGSLDEAEHAFRRAQTLDPSLLDGWYLHGRLAFQAGRFREAARLFRRAEAVRPDPASAFFAAQSLEAAADGPAAVHAFRHAAKVALDHLALNPDRARVATMAAVALCRTGRRAEGLAWAERALAADPEDAGVRYNVACLYAVAGEPERALACLEEARGMGFGNRAWLERDPDLEAVREHPRFRELLDGM